MLIYKVLRAKGDRLYSYVDNPLLTIEYKPGEPTMAPEGTKLLAFEYLEDALTLARYTTASTFPPGIRNEVWSAESIGNDSPLYIRRLALIEDIELPHQIELIWRYLYGDGEELQDDEQSWIPQYGRTPRGTIGVDGLTLIERLWY